jgi:hypothetical protein
VGVALSGGLKGFHLKTGGIPDKGFCGTCPVCGPFKHKGVPAEATYHRLDIYYRILSLSQQLTASDPCKHKAKEVRLHRPAIMLPKLKVLPKMKKVRIDMGPFLGNAIRGELPQRGLM